MQWTLSQVILQGSVIFEDEADLLKNGSHTFYFAGGNTIRIFNNRPNSLSIFLTTCLPYIFSIAGIVKTVKEELWYELGTSDFTLSSLTVTNLHYHIKLNNTNFSDVMHHQIPDFLQLFTKCKIGTYTPGQKKINYTPESFYLSLQTEGEHKLKQISQLFFSGQECVEGKKKTCTLKYVCTTEPDQLHVTLITSSNSNGVQELMKTLCK